MSQQKPIILFAGVVSITENLTMQHAKDYLKKRCMVDSLGDTLYVKKPGNDQTTFAIEFSLDEISKVRKIKDSDGNNLDEIIFEKDDSDYDLDDSSDNNSDNNSD